MRYYISWIGRNAEGNVYLIPGNLPYFDLEAAKKETHEIIEVFGKKIVSIWIDQYDDNYNKIATIDYRVLINILGQYTGVNNGSYN